jgi:tRNA-2-methylthio-N6-dimethylallyladenosine synthase
MKASVYIETFGCQMNVADTERAATSLRAAGYDLSKTISSADVVLFNTCSIREKAAQKVLTRIGEVGGGKAIGVMGCVAQLEGEAMFRKAPSLNLVVGTRATDRLPSLIERVLGGETRAMDLDERGEGEEWKVSPVERHSPFIGFVPIIEGCNKFCSFCIVPFSRGREKSRRAIEIVKEVEDLRDQGFNEVHLIGQNVNSYRPKDHSGLDAFAGATPFCKLLRAVAATGIPRIKFTTSFPRDFHSDIVKALDEHENLCNWVHLPVQSGSDKVLRSMRRGYQVKDYVQRVEAIKDARKRIALTSDIIVGFPGETAEDFEATLRLAEYCQYDGMYIFKYSMRPRTPASRLPDHISNEEKTERFLKLESLQSHIQRRLYQSYVGSNISVLVEGKSSRSALAMTGHSSCQKVINFPGSGNLAGRIVKIRVTEVRPNSLYGEKVG